MPLSALTRFPQIVQFETSTECNANCLFCGGRHTDRPRGAMDWRLIEHILDGATGAQSVIPFLLGEPFVEPRLLDILRAIRERVPSAYSVLYSNMAACTRRLATTIIEEGLLDQICISFYAPTPDLYRRWQPPLDYEEVRKKIMELVMERDARGARWPQIYMHYLMIDELAPHFDAFRAQWESIVDRVEPVAYDDWHGTQPDRGLRFYARGLPRTPCYRLWQSLNIVWDGRAVACCIDHRAEAVIGDLRRNTVEGIWHGRPLARLRRLHRERRFDEIAPCRSCQIWEWSNPEWWVRFWLEAVYGEPYRPPAGAGR
ncbi:MAG: radical SAM/SPASM domain-containing protein [Bacillota bacterium]